MIVRPVLALTLLALSMPAQAEDDPRPRRTRVALGPQLVPSYPGAGRVSLRPLVDVSRARGDDPFAFEAPDESFGFPLLRARNVAIGPALSFEGKRRARDVGAALPELGFTIEAGGFVQHQLAPALRLRTEIRKGLGGHRGWLAVLEGDYVARDRDRWLISLGPRLTLADGRYHRAYFGVSPTTAAATGLPAFTAKGGV